MVTLQAAFAAMVLSGMGQTVLLDFYSDTCGPCRAMNPTVQALEKAGYPVERVNISHDSAAAAKYGVQRVPCFVMIVDGKVADRLEGTTTFSRLERMCKLGAPASAPGQSPPMLAQQGPPTVQPVSTQPISFPTKAAGISDAALIAATVRLRVADPKGRSCGSGTIIDARGGEAMILTCGHIFRDSQGEGQITVDLFAHGTVQQIPGYKYDYDLDRDVGLVRIRVPGPVATVRVAPPGYRVAPGTPVVSVGCSNGDAPTAQHSQVTALEKFVGPANLPGPSNIEVAGQPVEGRSGGGLFSGAGLFSGEGYLIGICNAADPSDKEGVFAGLGSIYAELDQTKLSFIYKSPSANPSVSPDSPAPGGILLANATIPIAKPMPGAADPVALASAPAAEAPAGLPPHEQAALEEIRRLRKEGADIVLVIRPRDNPNAKSEVLMLDHASPDFVRMVTADARPSSGRFPTSLDLPAPRKVLLEWSKDGKAESERRKAEEANDWRATPSGR